MHLYLHAIGVSNDHYQSDRAICTNDHKMNACQDNDYIRAQ